jgi:hypothetical protein
MSAGFSGFAGFFYSKDAEKDSIRSNTPRGERLRANPRNPRNPRAAVSLGISPDSRTSTSWTSASRAIEPRASSAPRSYCDEATLCG